MNTLIEVYSGLLMIGDPHLESRVPGFRKDDYPRVVLNKVVWCLNYARENQLLPVFLGDVFHLPRDNANWLLGELMVHFHPAVLGIYGNHDVRQNELAEDDSLDVLVKAGRYILLDGNPWRVSVNGQLVVVGGTSWGRRLPESFDRNTDAGRPALVFWVSHHDVRVPGYEDQGRFDPRPISGIDVVVNGHIHRRLSDCPTGSTLWVTPGNIARRSRSDATEQHVPAALRIDIDVDSWAAHHVEVPHQPFDEVFYASLLPDPATSDDMNAPSSAFVNGLAEMLARKTDTAAGLMAFLELNLGQFDKAVAEEIRKLAEEITNNGR